MFFGFFGERGLNQLLNVDGEGFYFTIEKDGKSYDRFFPNVGQPNQKPSVHIHHVDVSSYNSDVYIEYANFNPFYAKYRLFNNEIEIIAAKGYYLFRADFKDTIRFYLSGNFTEFKEDDRIGQRFYVRGIEFDQDLSGEMYAVISQRSILPGDYKDQFAKAGSELQAGIRKYTPRNVSQCSVFYNIMISQDLFNRYFVPINRVWIKMLDDLFHLNGGSYNLAIFGWDNAFASIILAEFDLDLAKKNLLSIFEGQQEDGRIPQLRLGNCLSNRTNPPIWFLAAEKIYQSSQDKKFLEEIFPKLLKNYEWFKKNRMNRDGTFSWGIDHDAQVDPLNLSGKIGAMMESGLDDSPIFDEMELSGNKLNYACIDLSCLMYRAAEIMEEFNYQLRYGSKEYLYDLSVFKGAIHVFFNFGRGIANSFSANKYANELTPVSFYPLLTGFLNHREVNLLEALFDSEHFRETLPSLSYDSKYYNGDGDYWRGRFWPPMIYLVAQGFKRYHSQAYHRIKDWAEQLLMNEWDRHHHIHENYSSKTGNGEPEEGVYARSCPFYSWGGLLGIL